MIETKDGGSAFPLSGPLTTSDNLGMTLRDYFAAKAMGTAFNKAIHNWREEGEPNLVIDCDFTLKIPLAFVRVLEHNTVMDSRLARIELEEQIMNYQGVRENAAKKLSNSKTRMEMSAIEAATMGATVPASSQIFNERGWLFTENGKHFWIERSSLTLATMDLENYEVLK